LSPADIHVWTVGIGDQPDDILRSRAAVLTPDELQRADRFARDSDRQRFVLCRGAVRLILARYTGRSPAELAFASGPHGKPFLVGEDRGRPGASVNFNVSHSGEIAVVAVAESPVGIDVEQIRTMPDADRLAARFFSPYEREVYRSLDPEARLSAFFRCWTRKEAFVKARGDGLSLPLAYFDVTLTPSDPQLLRIGGTEAEARHWTLHGFEPAVGYVAALAVRRRGVRLSSFAQ
jgi:4'-phosphopantetheinyl transferase